ncbi:DUF4393 domain-containing protein [Deinococcus ruber]|uniref:DUF4393 domain-containing protein n=1 Tax=Deinococcus ruber TaxID=1848197 RepID=A0A918FET1_9DEIO|nr:DUF4393 domain-containing protein [Deinococcus ruber]GGR31489.1 hypothetical protein GCM10008957_47760 [Deinococcus ruber]
MSDDKSSGSESPIQSTAQAIAVVAKEVPVYQDLAQPALKELGKGIGGFTAWAMQYLVKLGISAGKNIEIFEKEYGEKISNISSDKVITPDAMIGIPVLQALSYTAHHDEIRQMFVNLLATASNEDTRNSAHPAFVEIIRQLSPRDALLVDAISKRRRWPLVRVDLILQDRSSKPISGHVSAMSSGVYDYLHSSSLENLRRLGLIDIKYDTQLKNHSLYDGVILKIKETYPDINTLDKVLGSGSYLKADSVGYVEGYIDTTAFGLSFISSCL